MRMRSRKKKDRFNSPINIQPQLQSRPFDDKSHSVNQTADLQNQPEKVPQSGINFGDIAIFAANQTSASNPIQAKLTIGAPGDKYEQEADAVASRVVNQINSPPAKTVQREQVAEEDDKVQTKPEINSLQRSDNPDEEDKVQTKPAVASFFSDLVQRKPDGGGTATPQLESSINQSRGKGEPLAEGIKQPMEQAFGADFSSVKVYTDAESNQMNQSIQAKAFTTGKDIFFKQGAYNPGTRSGQTLIAHELTHVVQQNGTGIQRQTLIQRDGDDIPTNAQERGHELSTIIVGRRQTNQQGIAKIRALLAAGDLGTVKQVFYDKTGGKKTLRQAIEETFAGQGYAKEYLLQLCAGKSQSFLAQLLIASGLSGLTSSRDIQEMVTLVEYASPTELTELNQIDGGNLTKTILNQITKFGRHQDKKRYVKAIIKGNELRDSPFIEEFDSLEDLPTDTTQISDKGKLKRRELSSLFNILRGMVVYHRAAKKLTTPEAEERIMQWAARQTPEAREYVARDGGLADRYLSDPESEIPKGYRRHILNLIRLDYGAYTPEAFSNKQQRQEQVNQLVAQEQPKALVSYLLHKKQRFGHGIGRSQAQVLGGGILGYWDGLAKRIENLTPEGRFQFLQEFFQETVTDGSEFTRDAAIEKLQEQLTSIGGNQNKEAFQRMLNALRAEATKTTTERRSTPNLLRILVERWFISGNRLQFTSRDAVELVSKLQPSEYLEVIRNRDLLTKLKAIVGTEEWERISEILGLAQWRDLDESDDAIGNEIPTIPLEEENVDAIAHARSAAANLIELRPGHWAAKLSHELEKGYLAIHATTYTSLMGRAWDRNRVFSLVDQAYNAARRKTEDNSEVVEFMNEVKEHLTVNAKQALNDERLAAAKQSLEQGRQLSAAERVQGTTFRAWYKGGIGKRWFRGRGMRERSLLSAIIDAQGEQLLEWSNVEQLEQLINSDDISSINTEEQQTQIALIKNFKLDIKPEFRHDLRHELPASEFDEVYSTLIYKLANALEKDEIVKEKISSLMSGDHVPNELQDLDVAAELLRFKALRQSENLNSTGVQWDFFSAKGTERRDAMTNLGGKVAEANQKLSEGNAGAIDKEALTEARKNAEGKKARFIEMRETAKKITLRCVGLILAAACTIGTGGLASIGFTGIGVSMALSAARALVLQAVSKALDGDAYNAWEGVLFEVIKDTALAATTFGAGELSNFIESTNARTLTKAAASDGKFAESLAKNFSNISPIEAALRTITGSSLEAMTSADHRDWYEKKSGIFWNTVVTAVKDSASKTLFDMSKLTYDGVDDDKGKSIFENDQEKLIPWIFAEMFTGQNVAVCEMTTLQDDHINLLSNKFAALVTKAASPQRPLELEEDHSSRPMKKLRYKQGLAHGKHKKRIGGKLVERAGQESDLRNNDTADIASRLLKNADDAGEKIRFLKIGLGASAYQCLALGYTPEEVSQYFAAKDIAESGKMLIEENKVDNSEIFEIQLAEVQDNEEDFITAIANERSILEAYKKDLLLLGSAGGKWADHYEIQSVARGLDRQIQLHKLQNNTVISTDSYGQGDPAYHLVIENNFHYGALKLNSSGNITIDGQKYEHVPVAPSGDCFYDALSRVSNQGIAELRQLAFNNSSLGEVKQSINSVILNLSIGEQLGVGRNMKAYYRRKANSMN